MSFATPTDCPCDARNRTGGRDEPERRVTAGPNAHAAPAQGRGDRVSAVAHPSAPGWCTCPGDPDNDTVRRSHYPTIDPPSARGRVERALGHPRLNRPGGGVGDACQAAQASGRGTRVRAPTDLATRNLRCSISVMAQCNSAPPGQPDLLCGVHHDDRLPRARVGGRRTRSVWDKSSIRSSKCWTLQRSRRRSGRRCVYFPTDTEKMVLSLILWSACRPCVRCGR
jgi:hypothetical protein